MSAARDSFLDYYRGDAGRRFLTTQTLWLAASALLLHLVFDYTELDHRLSAIFFDAAHTTFPLTNHWLLKSVLHDAMRTLSVALGATVGGAAALAWSTPRLLPRLHAERLGLTFAFTALLVAAVLVGALKHASPHACPWALAEFGGTAHYAHLFSATPAASVAGCFPAAHPLAGYAWLAVALVLLPRSARHAARAWRAAFVLGSALGAVQIARGAHFASHVLWSGWVAWAVDIVLLTAAVAAADPRRTLEGEPPVDVGRHSQPTV